MKAKFGHIIFSGVGGTTDYIINLLKGDTQGEFEYHVMLFGIEKPSAEHLAIIQSLAQTKVIIKEQGLDKNALKELHDYLVFNTIQCVSCHVNSLIVFKKKWLPDTSQLIFVEHQANHLKSRNEWVYSFLAQRRADWIVSLTQEYQNQLKKRLPLAFKAKKNKIIHTGIEIQNANPVREKCTKFLMAGRINHFRDHKTLLQSIHDDIELHIAGDGPLLEQLKAEFTQDNIIFHGNLSPTALSQLFRDADCYVQASKGETSSVAIMQAQSYGLPIIASAVNGINNVLTAENAILVEPENVHKMKTAIQTMQNDLPFRQKLARASYEFAQNNLDNVKMFNAYKALLS